MNYWFRTKRYGYGWVPSSWQGWLVLALYVLLSLFSFILVDAHSHSEGEMLVWFLPLFALLTLILLVITYKTGEKPQWRWGK